MKFRTLPALAALSAATSALLAATPAHAAGLPPPDTVTELAPLPNPFGYWTVPFTDPVNDLVFENLTSWGGGSASALTLAEFDGESLQLLHEGHLQSTREGASGPGVIAVDSEDRLVIYGNPLAGVAGIGSDDVAAISETDLAKVAEWQLPAFPAPGAALARVVGLQWLGDRRELVVTTDDGGGCSGISCELSGDVPPHGVVVTDLKIAPDLKSTVLWSTSITGCERALSSFFDGGGAGLALHDPVMTVPCRLNGANLQAFSTATDFSGPEVDGVVSVQMTATGCSGAVVCPTSQMTPVVAPMLASDFLFDPESDRGFMSHPPDSSGVTEVIYDGLHREFMGRLTLGGGLGSEGVTVDTDTGRVYYGGSLGIAFFDGRRTPVSPGSKFSEFTGNPGFMGPVVLPADQAHPYRRIFANLPHGGYNAVDPIRVFADTVPVGADPPAATIDANTDPAAAGSTAAELGSYGGTARAFGVHSDLVGSAAGAIANSGPYSGFVLGAYNAAVGAGNTDLVAGSLTGIRLDSGSAVGQAAAAADGNGNTSLGLTQCTDLQQLSACGGSVAPLDTSAAPKTGQLWPAPDATCSNPGSTTSGSAAGVYDTTWTTGPDGSPQPVQSVIPGTDQGGAAKAHVDCSGAAGSASGAAMLEAFGIEPTGAPSVSVASASAAGSISPPADAASLSKTVVTAVVSGLVLDDHAGHVLSIGRIEQDATAAAGGRPGTGATTDEVTFSDVRVENGGATDVICAGVCAGDPQQVVAQINATLPGLIRVSAPPADDRLLGPHGNASPGGYLAVVQANLAEQYGDHEFNGMSPEEASLLPALRIVVYDDGEGGLSREVLDFAGVEADAKLGLTLPFEAGGFNLESSSPLSLAATPSLGPTGLGDQPAVGGAGGVAGARTVLTALGHGFEWLRRSPLAALQMLLTLLLLGAPTLLGARRSA